MSNWLKNAARVSSANLPSSSQELFMTLPLNQYAKFKDRYCISYSGPSKEYLHLLSYLRPAIEAELPGIQIYLCGRKECLPDTERVFEISEIEQKRNELAYIRDLKCDLIHHPVEALLKESNLNLTYWTPPIQRMSQGKYYILCPNGTLPTKTLSPKQIDALKIKIGHLEISDNIENADWVIGVESVGLFKAAMLGIKTTLIATGLGTNLYKKLFPSGEIMDLWHI